MIRRVLAALVLAAALAGAGGCTRLAYLNAAVAYRNVPPMVSWMVDDYVDMGREQKAWLDERLARAMAWHRARELPRYRAFLGSIAQRSDAPFSEADVARAYEELREDYHRLIEHLLPDFAEFVAGLDERQIGQMRSRFEKDNARILKEAARGTAEERRHAAVDRAVAHIEPWTGRLAPEQRAIVAARYRASPDTLADRIVDRRYRQEQTLALARTHDRVKIAAGLRRLLLDTDEWRRPGYLEKARERDRQVVRMVAELSATLTPGQRAHLKARIGTYMDDITRLAAG